MEKIEKRDFPKLRNILKAKGYKKAKDYLLGEGFLRFKDLGWCRQDRVDSCIRGGFVKFDTQGELVITQKGAYVDFFGFIWGDKNKIFYPAKKKDEQEDNFI
jgi:hypothetical protein